jgi:hypothetical protein
MEEMRPRLNIRCVDTAKEIVKTLAVRTGKSKQLIMLNESATWARWQAELTLPTALAVGTK